MELDSRSLYTQIKDRQRQAGPPSQYSLYTRLYSGGCWPSQPLDSQQGPEPVHGAVFNIEFSPVNDIALTVCSNKSIVSYDPRLATVTPIHTVRNAHDEAVNCLTFLDPFSFATCSDDKTIRIWDMRQLKHCIAILQGHRNWIKNIEYDRKSGLLFSIAFKDGVREWNINKMTDYVSEECDNMVFGINDPMRMRISPDGNQMFISERDNRCWVIDRFDGGTIKEIAPLMESLRKPLAYSVLYRPSNVTTNFPAMFQMSGLKGGSSYRAVMSTCFFPEGQFIALRHMDVKNGRLHVENLTLFDLRGSRAKSRYNAKECLNKYLMFTDESSPRESLDFIKEISISKDGRVIASPYNGGVRLLALDPMAHPPSVYFDDRYQSIRKQMNVQELDTIQTITAHKHAVLSCKFANNELLLATGCIQGHVKFHKPYF